MVERGIRVEGVPLEYYLEDQLRKKFYKDRQAEIAEQKQLTYHSSSVKMTVKHNKRPSKIRHVTRQEYYMKENIANCESGGEYVLTIMQDGLPQSIISLAERFKHWEIEMSASGVRQAMIRIQKRYPDLFLVAQEKAGMKTKIYTMLPAVCDIPHIDLMALWRRNISWEQFVEIHLALKQALTSKVLDSPEARSVSITELMEKMDEILGRVIGMEATIKNHTQVLHGMGKERDGLIECNNGMERRVHAIEERLGHYLEDDTGSRHTLDVNFNFDFGRKGD